ncbi:hypothetical protein F2Q69_00047026 [Brassica cretica]|uniref:Uncharacterized protein n=1 Tax=Brassica cretica TaxID=69181 RepID=A0A8S9PJA4_BRACR|nr:hypothetical protein F2Q69_00047026 [Brassica cretica]
MPIRIPAKSRGSCLNFNTALINCRNVSMTPPLLIARSTVQEYGLARFTRFSQLPQRLYDTSSSHRQIYYTRVWTRQIYSVLHHRCVSITLNRLKHRRFFTESTLPPSYPFLVAVTIVQECGYA